MIDYRIEGGYSGAAEPPAHSEPENSEGYFYYTFPLFYGILSMYCLLLSGRVEYCSDPFDKMGVSMFDHFSFEVY